MASCWGNNLRQTIFEWLTFRSTKQQERLLTLFGTLITTRRRLTVSFAGRDRISDALITLVSGILIRASPYDQARKT